MRPTLFLALLFAGALFAGTNSLTSVPTSPVQKVRTSHVNQYYSALNQDFVPRNSSGVMTDLGGSLGQSSSRWDNLYVKKLVPGASASGLFIDDNSGKLRFGVGGAGIFEVDSTGITTAQVVPRSSIKAVGQQISGSSGVFTRGVATFADITNLSVTLTTVGRPVALYITSDNSGGAYWDAVVAGGVSSSCTIKIIRDANFVASWTLNSISATVNSEAALSLSTLDTPTAGTYVYKAQLSGSGTPATCEVINGKLIAYEL
jgi:hypothetical protein